MSRRLLGQVTFKNVVLLSQNVERTASFYSEIIGLKLLHQTPQFAELKDFNPKSSFSLLIKHAPTLAHASHGYSPILNFSIGQNADIDELVEKAKQDFDCQMDGEVMEDEYVKLVCLKTPDGQTLQLTQTLKEFETEAKYEEFVRKEGVSVHEKNEMVDPKTQELRELFQSIKL